MVDVYDEMADVFEGKSEILYHDFRWIDVNHLGGNITDRGRDYFSSGEKAQLTREKSSLARNDAQLWVTGSSQKGPTVNFEVVNSTFWDGKVVRDKMYEDPRHNRGAPVLSANAIPVDLDGYGWVDIRKRGLATYGGDRHTIGGAINPGEDSLDNAIRETGEELVGRDGSPVEAGNYLLGVPSPLAVLREPKTGYVQALYAMRLNRTSRQLKNTRNEHEGTKEAISMDPDALMSHVVSLANHYVPTGLAGLVLWGNDNYDSGWTFEALSGIRREFRDGGERATTEAITV